MTELIACASNEKGALKHVQNVVEREEWSNIIIITSQEFDNKQFSKKTELIKIDLNKTLQELIEELTKTFKNKIKDTEVGLNLICGTGKEHMAILSALLKSGLGIRLVALTKEGRKEV